MDHPPLKEILFEPLSPNYDPQAYELFMHWATNQHGPEMQDRYEDLLDYFDWYYDIDFDQEFEWDWY